MVRGQGSGVRGRDGLGVCDSRAAEARGCSRVAVPTAGFRLAAITANHGRPFRQLTTDNSQPTTHQRTRISIHSWAANSTVTRSPWKGSDWLPWPVKSVSSAAVTSRNDRRPSVVLRPSVSSNLATHPAARPSAMIGSQWVATTFRASTWNSQPLAAESAPPFRPVPSAARETRSPPAPDKAGRCPRPGEIAAMSRRGRPAACPSSAGRNAGDKAGRR